jgi:hypothetical protein
LASEKCCHYAPEVTSPAHSGSPPLRLSRSRLALFLECPRCFRLAMNDGAPRPDGGPLRLHLAVDSRLKREFDECRLAGRAHPAMTLAGVDAVPLDHPRLEEWRDFRRGIAAVHAASHLELYGAVDDLWVHPDGRVSVADYKATSARPPVSFAGPNYDGYRRQLEIYRWLAEANGLPAFGEDYWVVANADPDRESEGGLPLALSVVPYAGDCRWVPDALKAARECLDAPSPPPPARDCRWCKYRQAAAAAEAAR